VPIIRYHPPLRGDDLLLPANVPAPVLELDAFTIQNCCSSPAPFLASYALGESSVHTNRSTKYLQLTKALIFPFHQQRTAILAAKFDKI